MKTAMQELLEYLKLSETNQQERNHLAEIFEPYMEKEKQQIIDAGNKCISNWCLHECERHGNEMPNGEQYFKKNFQS